MTIHTSLARLLLHTFYKRHNFLGPRHCRKQPNRHPSLKLAAILHLSLKEIYLECFRVVQNVVINHIINFMWCLTLEQKFDLPPDSLVLQYMEPFVLSIFSFWLDRLRYENYTRTQFRRPHKAIKIMSISIDNWFFKSRLYSLHYHWMKPIPWQFTFLSDLERNSSKELNGMLIVGVWKYDISIASHW